MADSVDPDQTAPIGAVCSVSTLFASILIRQLCQAIICSRRLQQTTFSDAFFLGPLRVNLFLSAAQFVQSYWGQYNHDRFRHFHIPKTALNFS